MNVFYDLGSHLFEGLEKFNEIYKFDDTWKIYCFEANPHTFGAALQTKQEAEWMQNLNIELINAAVSNKNGTTDFECYFDTDQNSYTDVGSTTLTLRDTFFKEVHKDDIYAEMGEDYCRVESIPTVCFSEFLDKNTSYGDQVIVKMDIEGSEFDTLTDMIMNNTHNHVKTFYIEWHERFWPDDIQKYTDWKNKIINRLVSSDVDVRNWW
jgi:FkbM family methyltransferase